MTNLSRLELFKNIVCDFDGVLYDTESANLAAYEQVFKEFALPFRPEIFDTKMGRSFDQALSAMGIRLSENDVSSIRSRKSEVYKSFFNLIRRNDLLFAKFDTLLQDERKKLFIVSSARRTNIDNLLSFHEDQGYFSGIIARDDVDRPKPHPEPYLSCLSVFALERSSCIVLEDSEPGLQSAKAAGLETMHVTVYND